MLSGLRILDLSMFVAGPFATAVLADMGAEIIKIEPPGGDPVRHNKIGPQISGQSAQFHTYNHGKKSLVLDLKEKTGKRRFLELAKHSDVVFDNFRPGVMERLGIDHQQLAAGNPKIVSVSLSGFGSTGPWAARAGYDLIVQALGGALSLCGHEQTGPAHIPYHIGDTGGGLYAAIAVLGAVLEAQRGGVGRHYEVSMLDAQIHLLGDEITFALTGRWSSPMHGSGHPALAPYSVYQTADQPIVIAAVGTEKFWHNLISALGLEELADDKRFRDNGLRSENMELLNALLAKTLTKKPASTWLEIFEKCDVPAAPVLKVAQAAESDQVRQRQLIGSTRTANGQSARIARLPFRAYGDIDGLAETETPALDSAKKELVARFNLDKEDPV